MGQKYKENKHVNHYGIAFFAPKRTVLRQKAVLLQLKTRQTKHYHY